jgi:hypothetical protein
VKDRRKRGTGARPVVKGFEFDLFSRLALHFHGGAQLLGPALDGFGEEGNLTLWGRSPNLLFDGIQDAGDFTFEGRQGLPSLDASAALGVGFYLAGLGTSALGIMGEEVGEGIAAHGEMIHLKSETREEARGQGKKLRRSCERGGAWGDRQGRA